MNTQRIRPYSKDNLPSDLNSALDKMSELSQAITLIHSQMAQIKVVMEDRQIPWEDPRKKEAIAWKARANVAKGFKEHELTFLKNWVRCERQKNQQFATLTTIDPEDPKSLLAASRNVLQKMAHEGVELQPDEQELVNLIERYLGLR